ncbi:hypothetical protein AHA02nite_29760 [Alkalibacillus haloalkaliphilus]|uniref:Uncharacterized protein n=1 Tax=Alkalibacillus haloalkaliphilus TaxID=94136 RepID=A0A511W7Y7_9BACI|nr:hypothetical protein AHA02nite_29760 [Alkalibacillus haloalkaliphilus]
MIKKGWAQTLMIEGKGFSFNKFIFACVKIFVVFTFVVALFLVIISLLNINNNNHAFVINNSVYTGVSTVYISLVVVVLSPVLGSLIGIIFGLFYYMPVKWTISLLKGGS